ncbi:hypothetical protein NL676_036711 [Syzygium grande]|nr:hypothetical protein NL676_036711 [Syzygium grande]
MDADFNRFILLQEGKLVELWCLDAVAKLLGQDASTEDRVKTNATGYIHECIRSSVLRHFGPERFRDDLLPPAPDHCRRNPNFLDGQGLRGCQTRMHCSNIVI